MVSIPCGSIGAAAGASSSIGHEKETPAPRMSSPRLLYSFNEKEVVPDSNPLLFTNPEPEPVSSTSRVNNSNSVSNIGKATEDKAYENSGTNPIAGEEGDEPIVTVSIQETPPPRPKSNPSRCPSKKRVKVETKDLESAGSVVVPCSVCGKTVRQTSLSSHMKRSHLDEGVVLKCPLCGKAMKSKGIYYKHMHGHRQKGQLLLPSNPIFTLNT